MKKKEILDQITERTPWEAVLRAGEGIPLVTARELATMLGVQTDTLRKWRVAGKGPKFIRETSRTVVYLRKSVMKWLEESEVNVQIAYKRKRERGGK